MKILVIGSANVDTTLYVERFPNVGETLIANSLSFDVGGKGLNQAIAIRRAGGNVTFLCALGNDENAKIIKNTLDKEKINYKFITKSNATGTAFIAVNENGDNQIIIDKGANGELNKQDIIDNIEIIKNADYIVLQGELSAESNEFIMEMGRKYNKIIFYNPAPYKELEKKYYQFIDYYLPNESELALTIPEYSTFKERCKELKSRGVKSIIVTLGARGSFYYGDESFNVDAFKVNAIDTVAAGDTYIGYFVASLSKGFDIKTSMVTASKASAIVVTKKGAANVIPNLNEVESFEF